MGIKLPLGFCRRCAKRLDSRKAKWCDAHRPPAKYKNRKTRGWDSEKEMKRAPYLLSLQKAGLIRNLQTQVPFVLKVAGRKVATYTADFTYEIWENNEWRFVVEDVKGYRTAYYKLKARLFRAVMGYAISEV